MGGNESKAKIDKKLLTAESLDISEKNLSEFPKGIEKCICNILDAHENDFTSIPEELFQIPNLEVLILSHNRITCIPDCIKIATGLRELNIERNNLFFDGISSEIKECTNLQRLDISGNKLESIPKEIGELMSLEYLNLGDNSLKTLPAEIGMLDRLQTLLVNKNSVRKLPSEIGNLRNLYELDLSNNQMDLLPEELGNLLSLKILRIGFNKLSGSIDVLTNFKFLVELDCQSNQGIQELPPLDTLQNMTKLVVKNLPIVEIPGLASLKMLCELNIRDNSKMNGIPDDVFEINSLQRLDFVGCNMTTLPEQITNLTNLNSLELGHNSLGNDSFPEGISTLTNITKFSCSANQISVYPKCLCDLTSIVELDVSNNLMVELPDEFCELTNVQTLNVAGNRLGRFPDCLGKLISVTYLDGRNNRLKALPASIGDLRQLNRLDLTQNMIATLPVELAHLENILQTIELTNNPLVVPPKEIVLKGARDICKYLKDYEGVIKGNTVSGLDAPGGAMAAK